MSHDAQVLHGQYSNEERRLQLLESGLDARPPLSIKTGHSSIPTRIESPLDAITSEETSHTAHSQADTVEDEYDDREEEEVEEEDFDPSLFSPILRNALIESPREQEIVNVDSKLRSQERTTRLLGSLQFTSFDNMSKLQRVKGIRSSKERLNTPLEEGDIITPGGSKKAVKFGHTKVLDTADAHSDYFSMASGSQASSPVKSRQSSFSGRSCLVNRSRASSISRHSDNNTESEQIAEDVS